MNAGDARFAGRGHARSPRRRPPEAAPWLGAEALVTLPHVPRRRAVDWLQRLRLLLAARRLALLAGGLLAAWGLGHAGYLQAKAGVAQWLLRDAWTRTLTTHRIVRPWPGADTWPTARLRVPRLGIDQIVLAGASGRTLAFGPALSTAAARPGAPGLAVLSGHRDTHFAFLRALRVGDRLWLDTAEGRFAYAVESFAVVDARGARLPTAREDSRLALVTCYPFEALTAGGPLRYVAEARLLARAEAAD